jgi:hypothetical protein
MREKEKEEGKKKVEGEEGSRRGRRDIPLAIPTAD